MTAADRLQTRATETVIGRAIRAIVLENDLVSATVLLDLGADIHTLVYKPTGLDVLWKSPLPVREPGVGAPPSGDSLVLWRTYYRGGWNVLLPNFGSATVYEGAPLDVHGEAARTAWQLEQIENDESGLRITVSAGLLQLPFRIRRTLSLVAGQPSLAVRETVTNEGPAAMPCIWGHHPAFGAPFLSAETVLDTGARQLEADDDYEQAGNDIPGGTLGAWPYINDRVGTPVDLSRLPARDSGYTRAVYLKDFEQGWYALTNQALGLGVGIAWDKALLPYACLWHQTGGIQGYPWYGKAYVVAVEPVSSYPGQGLMTAMQKTGTHLMFAPGESRTLNIRAVFYEGAERVSRVDLDGAVHRR